MATSSLTRVEGNDNKNQHSLVVFLHFYIKLKKNF